MRHRSFFPPCSMMYFAQTGKPQLKAFAKGKRARKEINASGLAAGSQPDQLLIHEILNLRCQHARLRILHLPHHPESVEHAITAQMTVGEYSMKLSLSRLCLYSDSRSFSVPAAVTVPAVTVPAVTLPRPLIVFWWCCAGWWHPCHVPKYTCQGESGQ